MERRDGVALALVSLLALGGAARKPPQAAEENGGLPEAGRRATLEVRFLGTGAANYDWRRLGEPGIRGSASTLLDRRVLLDCGTTGWENLSRFGIDPAALTDLVVTHSHSDHFCPEAIARVLAARGNAPPLAIHAPPQALAMLAGTPTGYAGHPVRAGDVFHAGGFGFAALPANHMIEENPEEETLHYLVETPAGRLLYAVDGAWMTTRARKLIGDKRLDLAIWDATMADPGDYRVFEHCDLDMIAAMTNALRRDGVVHDETIVALTHIGNAPLWSADPEAARRQAARHGFLLAWDGLALTLTAARDMTRLPDVWRFILDPEGKGAAAGFADPGFDDAGWEDIRIDALWDDQPPVKAWRGRTGATAYLGDAWYRTPFSVPELGDARMVLRFGAVDDGCDVYVNGTKIDSRRYNPDVDPNSWRQPFELDITSHVKTGANQLTVMVNNAVAAGGIWKGAFLKIIDAPAPGK